MPYKNLAKGPMNEESGKLIVQFVTHLPLDFLALSLYWWPKSIMRKWLHDPLCIKHARDPLPKKSSKHAYQLRAGWRIWIIKKRLDNDYRLMVSYLEKRGITMARLYNDSYYPIILALQNLCAYCNDHFDGALEVVVSEKLLLMGLKRSRGWFTRAVHSIAAIKEADWWQVSP